MFLFHFQSLCSAHEAPCALVFTIVFELYFRLVTTAYGQHYYGSFLFALAEQIYLYQGQAYGGGGSESFSSILDLPSLTISPAI